MYTLQKTALPARGHAHMLCAIDMLMYIQSNFNGSNTFGTIKLVRDRSSSSQ